MEKSGLEKIFLKSLDSGGMCFYYTEFLVLGKHEVGKIISRMEGFQK